MDKPPIQLPAALTGVDPAPRFDTTGINPLPLYTVEGQLQLDQLRRLADAIGDPTLYLEVGSGLMQFYNLYDAEWERISAGIRALGHDSVQVVDEEGPAIWILK